MELLFKKGGPGLDPCSVIDGNYVMFPFLNYSNFQFQQFKYDSIHIQEITAMQDSQTSIVGNGPVGLGLGENSNKRSGCVNPFMELVKKRHQS